MSRDEDFEQRARRLDAAGRRALLDDLESIRALLDEEGADADAIPVLREVVGPSAPAPAPPAAEERGEAQGDLFDPRAFADRLLDPDWEAERERILDDARAGLDAFSLGLDEISRREREDRLRAAVEARLAPRMEQVLGEALDELRTALLRVVRRELDALLAEVFAPAEPGTDGNRQQD